MRRNISRKKIISPACLKAEGLYGLNDQNAAAAAAAGAGTGGKDSSCCFLQWCKLRTCMNKLTKEKACRLYPCQTLFQWLADFLPKWDFRRISHYTR
jgi:hypothetical protein